MPPSNSGTAGFRLLGTLRSRRPPDPSAIVAGRAAAPALKPAVQGPDLVADGSGRQPDELGAVTGQTHLFKSRYRKTGILGCTGRAQNLLAEREGCRLIGREYGNLRRGGLGDTIVPLCHALSFRQHRCEYFPQHADIRAATTL